MGDLFASLSAWLERNTAVVWLLLGLSVASIVLVVTLLPGMVARVPADHFASSRRPAHAPRTTAWWLRRIAKNVLGVVFVMVGIVLVLLPGQGVLTILLGVFLLDFPGKRSLERSIVRRPGIKRVLDRMREKRGQPPFAIH